MTLSDKILEASRGHVGPGFTQAVEKLIREHKVTCCEDQVIRYAFFAGQASMVKEKTEK